MISYDPELVIVEGVIYSDVFVGWIRFCMRVLWYNQ